MADVDTIQQDKSNIDMSANSDTSSHSSEIQEALKSNNKNKLKELLQNPEIRKDFENDIYNYAEKKLNGTHNIKSTNDTQKILDGDVSFEKDETVLRHIIQNVAYEFDPNNSEKSNFSKLLQQSISDHVDFAQQHLINFYSKKIRPNLSDIELTEKKPSIIIPQNNETSEYVKQFNKDLIKVSDDETADWLSPTKYPYYTQDPFTNRVYKDANQVSLLMQNAKEGYPYINYAPVNIILDSKKHWLKNIEKQQKKDNICRITYTGLDEKGNKTYKMVSPTKKFNQNVIRDIPSEQPAIPNIGLNQQFPQNIGNGPNMNGLNNIEQYITNIVSNYLNSAFVKTSNNPPEWTGQHTEKLAEALHKDPNMGIRMAENAFSNAASIVIPQHLQQQSNVIKEKIQNDPSFKEQFFNDISRNYFDKKEKGEKLPNFLQYMDHISHTENSPTTPNNIKSRLETLYNVPAIQNDMIISHSNLSNNNTQKQSTGRGR